VALDILLVDNDAAHERHLLESIAVSGVAASLRRASSGRDAISYLLGQGDFFDRTKHPVPSVILLDLRLPDMPGLEVLTWIHERAEHRKIPVVVLSSWRENFDVRRALDLGAHSHLAKPVPPDELGPLLEAVHQYWSARRMPPG